MIDNNLLNEFECWLRDDSERWNDKASVSSYKSGMGAFIIWFNTNRENDKLWKFEKNRKPKLKSFFEYIKIINYEGDRETFFSAALNIIQVAIINSDEKSSPTRETLQNFKSYIKAFEQFLNNKYPLKEPLKKELPDNHRNLLRKNCSSATYTMIELKKEFQDRILKQDRVSSAKDVLFPIRLIHLKLWKNEAEKWAKEVCENIYLILGKKEKNSKNDDKFKEICLKQLKDFKDDDTLKITRKGEVYVKINTSTSMSNKENKDYEEYTLCSSYSDPHEFIKIDSDEIYIMRKLTVLSHFKKPKSFLIDKNQNIIDSDRNKVIYWHIKPIKAKSLGEIVIDHDIPISQILIDKKNQLKLLKSLSEKYSEISRNYKLSLSSKNVNKFLDLLNGTDIEELRESCSKLFPEKDMSIIGRSKLVLMGSKENGKKSDS